MKNENVILSTYMLRSEKKYKQLVKKYVDLGVRSIRVNCTRFTKEEYLWQVDQYRNNFIKEGVTPKIMVDIPYPGDKERVFFDGNVPYEVKKGNKYELVYSTTTEGIKDLLIVKQNDIFRKLEEQDLLIIGDGEVAFKVYSTNGYDKAVIEAVNNGKFALGKALTSVTHPFTKKCDEKTKKWLIELLEEIQPDDIALSFCESLDEIYEMKKLFPQSCVVPKIETECGFMNILNLFAHVDEVMLGRGDFGIQRPYLCSSVQDELIHLGVENNKKIIIATGILVSLGSGNIIPSRAEMMDIYQINKFKNTKIVLPASCTIEEDIFERAMKYIELL